MNSTPTTTGHEPTELAIVLAEVPFSTCRGTKIRPFLIWRDCGLDYWGFPLSAHAPRSRLETTLDDWCSANLRGPGTVRVASGCPIAKERVGRLIGRVSRSDAEKIAAMFATLFVVKKNEPSLEEELNLAFA